VEPGLSSTYLYDAIARPARPHKSLVCGGLDVGIRTGEYERLVVAVAPAYEVGRAAVGVADLDDLGLSRVVADVRAHDDEVVTY
jgi:hypothetical protein